MLRTKLGTIKQVNPDADRIILVDSTGVYGETIYTPSEEMEGEYTAAINDSGYGAPNLTREEVVNYIVGVNKKVAGDVLVEFDPYSIFDGTEYRAIINEDGWYQFNMITLPIYEFHIDIPVGEYGYNEGVIRYNTGDEFSIMAPVDLLGTAYSSPTVEQLFVGNASIKKHELISLIVEYTKTDSTVNKPKITRLKVQHDSIRVILTGSIYEYCRGNKYNAQTNIEWLNKYITDLVYGL